MAGKGITEAMWDTPEADRIRKGARGHATTPERPSQASKRPDKYPEYVQRRSDEMRQLQARKQRLFGDRIKYNNGRSYKATLTNPRTQEPPKTSYVRKFLRMTETQIEQINWSDDEWGFLFYH
jgi:hypothetical protein